MTDVDMALALDRVRAIRKRLAWLTVGPQDGASVLPAPVASATAPKVILRAAA